MALVTMSTLIPDLASAEILSDASMPGLGSFIVFAFLAVALYFLLRNMNARLRRMSYREKEREAAEAEAAERGATTEPTTPEPGTPEDRTP